MTKGDRIMKISTKEKNDIFQSITLIFAHIMGQFSIIYKFFAFCLVEGDSNFAL